MAGVQFNVLQNKSGFPYFLEIIIVRRQKPN